MSANLWCSEDQVWLVGEKGYRLGEGHPYETFTDDRGELFRACRRHLGRVSGSVYVDVAGKPTRVGWVFLKKNPDGEGIIETWVTVYTEPPMRVTRLEGGSYADL